MYDTVGLHLQTLLLKLTQVLMF